MRLSPFDQDKTASSTTTTSTEAVVAFGHGAAAGTAARLEAMGAFAGAGELSGIRGG